MKLSIIEAGKFKLDGGAMFGVVPKSLWAKLNPPDDQNLCTWSMRSLLIETKDRKIIIDTGIGNKQNDKFRSHFHPTAPMGIVDGLKEKGLNPEEITDVFLTHLHFDHVGGAVYREPNNNLALTFPNATYWSNKEHWEWALNPNPREAASFLKENIIPIQESGKLEWINCRQDTDVDWIENIKIRTVYGHTEAMMLPIIPYEKSNLVYCADLIPSSMHIASPYIMSYDLRPLKTIEEKERLLKEAEEKDLFLFYEHDPKVAFSKIIKNDKGRFQLSLPSIQF
jgi:glyoxylase-like metal-dependent hydrolase (beta-lactamase superfamily II)